MQTWFQDNCPECGVVYWLDVGNVEDCSSPDCEVLVCWSCKHRWLSDENIPDDHGYDSIVQALENCYECETVENRGGPPKISAEVLVEEAKDEHEEWAQDFFEKYNRFPSDPIVIWLASRGLDEPYERCPTCDKLRSDMSWAHASNRCPDRFHDK